MSMSSKALSFSTLHTQENQCHDESGLYFHRASMEVSYQSHTVRLTRKEYGILLELHAGQGRVCSRESLLVKVWGPHVFVDSRTIDRHVVQLRRKMKSLSRQELHVDTIWGIGYRLRIVNVMAIDSLNPSPE